MIPSIRKEVMTMVHSLRQYIRSGKHKTFRQELPQLHDLSKEYAALGLSPRERMTRRFETLCALEQPVILPGEQISFLRTVKVVPDVFTAQEWADIKSRHFIHELGYNSNLAPNYGKVIASGLEAVRASADAHSRRAIDAILDLTDRYRAAALAAGRADIAAVLQRGAAVLPHPPLQSLAGGQLPQHRRSLRPVYVALSAGGAGKRHAG